MAVCQETRPNNEEMNFKNLDLYDERSFSEYLKLAAKCLGGYRILKTNVTAAAEKRIDERESEMYIRIIKSVLDEETALKMVKTFVKMSKVNKKDSDQQTKSRINKYES